MAENVPDKPSNSKGDKPSGHQSSSTPSAASKAAEQAKRNPAMRALGMLLVARPPSTSAKPKPQLPRGH